MVLPQLPAELTNYRHKIDNTPPQHAYLFIYFRLTGLKMNLQILMTITLKVNNQNYFDNKMNAMGVCNKVTSNYFICLALISLEFQNIIHTFIKGGRL